MKTARLHRRLVILMSGLALTAFAAGAGVQPVAATLAYLGLILAFFWSPPPAVEERMAQIWPPLAILLALRVGVAGFIVRTDVVAPVVDLLLLLLVAEVLRSEDKLNDARLYALTLALVLASTAYRPGLLFGLAFTGYVVLATVTVPLGLIHRKASASGERTPAPGRGLMGTSVIVSAITLFMGGLVFFAFPRVTRGWAGQGEVMASSIAGFSDRVSIGDLGSRIYSNPEVVLRVEFPDGAPPPQDLLSTRWRGRSYDRFDGTVWSRTPPQEIRPSRATDQWYNERWPGPVLRQDIYAAALDVRVIFGKGPVIQVSPESDIVPFQDVVGDWTYWGNSLPVYRAVSKRENPPAELLRQAEGGYMASRVHYLQLPRIPDRIAALADSLTRDHDNRYDKVMAVQRYLRNEFSYTRELPRTAGEATLDHFLFQRRAGHCEYFSTAMAVMLRSVGIHSRNVAGFLGGRWSEFGGYLAVTQNEAHSWVEVWFPNYGWVTFDPTPGGSSGGIAESGWNWPGRFWFDGLQHRWNKWILDYSVDNQMSFLDDLRRWLDREPGTRGDEGGPPAWIWLVLLATVLPVYLLIRGRPGRGAPPPQGSRGATRGYRGLLQTARRHGLVGPEPVGPLELVNAIARNHPTAAAPARRAVDTYTRVRFGSEALTADEAQAFRESIREARRQIRSAGTRTAP